MSKKTKIFFGIVVLVIILIGVVFALSRSRKQAANPLTATPLDTSSPLVTTGSTEPGSEFLSTLLNLNTIKLSPAVFSNPVFRSLSDVPVSLGEAQVGRANPFAPIGVSQTSITVSTAEATSITSTSARLNGTTFATLPETATVYFEWGLNESYGSTTPPVKPNATGVFFSDISGLKANTGYVFRAVYKNGARVSYGDMFLFITRSQTR